jgi:hypothetical protein
MVLQLLVRQGLNLGPPSLLAPYQDACISDDTYLARLFGQINGLRRLVVSPARSVVLSRFSYCAFLTRIDRRI